MRITFEKDYIAVIVDSDCIRPRTSLSLDIETEEIVEIINQNNSEGHAILKEISNTLNIIKEEVTKKDKDGY